MGSIQLGSPNPTKKIRALKICPCLFVIFLKALLLIFSSMLKSAALISVKLYFET